VVRRVRTTHRLHALHTHTSHRTAIALYTIAVPLTVSVDVVNLPSVDTLRPDNLSYNLTPLFRRPCAASYLP
jgi:hypothetical protein